MQPTKQPSELDKAMENLRTEVFKSLDISSIYNWLIYLLFRKSGRVKIDIALKAMQSYANRFQPNLIALENDRLQWALKTFPDATAISSLRKAEGEIKEIEETILAGKPCATEYADALMCIFDSAGRAGISAQQVAQAFAEKLAINKARTWVKNPDNTYSHVKL